MNFLCSRISKCELRRLSEPTEVQAARKNVYKRQPTSREAIAGIEPETQFGGMCAKLGIGIIAASSPQAKGRVERHHGTHQDRLIKKMRLDGIADYEAANRYLDEQYLDAHNAKFACQPAAGADFHRRLPKRLELKWVFVWRPSGWLWKNSCSWGSALLRRITP